MEKMEFKEFKNYNLEKGIKKTGIKILELNKKDIKLLKSCTHATSKDECRPVLQYVSVDKDNFVALDGYRLAFRKHGLKVDREILIHKEILKMTNLEKIIIYEENNILYYIINDNACYSIKKFDGHYIKYKSLIPDFSKEGKIRVNKKKITEILKNKDLNDNKLRLTIFKESLYLNIIEGKELRKNIYININNIDNISLNIGINKKYLKQAIGKAEKKEINIYFKSPVSPIIIGNEKYFDMILPIRIVGINNKDFDFFYENK